MRTCRARTEQDPQRPVERHLRPLYLPVRCASERRVLLPECHKVIKPGPPWLPAVPRGGGVRGVVDDDDFGGETGTLGEPVEEGGELREVRVHFRVVPGRTGRERVGAMRTYQSERREGRREGRDVHHGVDGEYERGAHLLEPACVRACESRESTRCVITLTSLTPPLHQSRRRR